MERKAHLFAREYDVALLATVRRFVTAIGLALTALPCMALHAGADTAFGSNSIAIVPTPGISNGASSTTRALVDAANKATIVTFRGNGFAVARLLPDGAADPAFNSGVARVVDVGMAMSAVGFDAAGRLMFVGGVSTPQGTTIVLCRLTVDGNLDLSFGDSGRRSVIVSLSDLGLPVEAQWEQVVPRTSGGFLLVGGLNVVAFDATGALDTRMWERGAFRSVMYPVEPPFATERRVLAARSDDSLVVAEPAVPFGTYVVKRMLPDGSVDAAFGNAIVALASAVPQLAQFDAQGRMYFLLQCQISCANYAVARILADGSLDTGYGAGGYAVQSMSNQLGLPKALGVAADGRAVIVARYRPQVGVAEATFRLFNANGEAAPSFGGRGVTRVEPFGYGYTGFIASAAVFNATNDRLLIAGRVSEGPDIAAIRLRLAFTHQILVTNALTAPAQPKYGELVRFSVDVDGDQGRPTGLFKMRVNGADYICERTLYDISATADHSETCSSDLTPAGAVTTSLEFAGDDFFLSTILPGPVTQISRARFDIVLTPSPQTPQLPKDVFPLALAARVPYVMYAPVTGQFEITDGVTGCSIPAATYAAPFLAACDISIMSPGHVRLFVRHVGDANFESVTNGEVFVDIAPAVLTSALVDAATGHVYSTTIATDDPHCGVKAIYFGSSFDPAIPPGAMRARARNGQHGLRTVAECTPGFSGSVSVVAQTGAAPLAAAWVRDAVSGWHRVAAINQTVSIPFIDNGTNDVESDSGHVLLDLIPESEATEAKCSFEVLTSVPDGQARILLMAAAGYSYSSIYSSPEWVWSVMYDWFYRLTCPSCVGELDINGDGRFDISDALVIARHYRGLSPAEATTTIVPAQSPAGMRTRAQAQAYLANGCK